MAAPNLNSHETPTSSKVKDTTPKYPNLSQLWPLGNSDEGVEVEVIAVHGLAANPATTWTKGEINWLSNAEFLPSIIPNARIWTFDFESRWLGRGQPIQQLQSLGGQLLELMDLKLTAPHRPVVFIAHSFGGVVVAEALVMARTRENYAGLLDLITGGIFLGTPFRGSGVIHFAQMIVDAAEAFGFKGTKKLLNHLHPDDELLNRLVDDFSRLANHRRLDMVCIYELLRQPIIKKRIFGTRARSSKLSKIIVPEESACLPGFERSALSTTHTQMNEFDDVNDTNYQRVSAHVQTIVKRAPGTLAQRSKKVTKGVQFFSIPHPRLKTFVGREDLLSQIEERMAWHDDKYQARVALCGQGGVGKTQLAVEYAYRTPENHALKGIYWVSGASVAKFKESYLRIGKKAKIVEDDSKESLQTIMEWLEDGQNGRWMMVIDNVDDLDILHDNVNERRCEDLDNDSGSSLLLKYTPNCSHGSILYTSRDRNACIDIAGPNSWVQVDQLTTDHCKLLVETSLKGNQYKDGGIDDLISAIEGLPLALTQAISYIEKSGITIRKYMELFNESDSSRIELLSKGVRIGGHASETIPTSVVTTCMISFNQIKKKNPLAANLLGFMSIVDRHCIPPEVLPLPEDAMERWKDPMTRGTTEIERCEAIGMLEGFSMISKSSGSEYWTMHALVHLSMHRWLQENGEYYYHVTSVLRGLVSGVFTGDPALYGCYLPYANAVIDHIANINELHPNYEGAMDEPGANQNLPPYLQGLKLSDIRQLAQLRQRIAAYYWTNYQFWKTEDWLESALEPIIPLYELELEEDLTVSLACDLSSTYLFQDRAEEALDLQIMAFEILEQHSEKSDISEDILSKVSIQLGLAYKAVGQYSYAEAIWDVLVTEYTESGERNRVDLLIVQANLASCYLSQGRLEESQRLFNQVLPELSLELPATSVILQDFRLDLIKSYGAKGEVVKAVQLVHALFMEKTELDDYHPRLLSISRYAAQILQACGQLREAEHVLECATIICDRAYASDRNILTLSIYLEYSKMLEQEEKNKPGAAKAVPALRLVVETGKGILTHEVFEDAMYRLAKVLVRDWRPDDARAAMRQYIETRGNRLGQDDPQVVAAVEELSGWTNLRSTLGLYEEVIRTLYLMKKYSDKYEDYM